MEWRNMKDQRQKVDEIIKKNWEETGQAKVRHS